MIRLSRVIYDGAGIKTYFWLVYFEFMCLVFRDVVVGLDNQTVVFKNFNISTRFIRWKLFAFLLKRGERLLNN